MSAARPTSEIDIVNLALLRLGQKVAASIESPTTSEEDVAALHYPTTRRALLRSYTFNFSKKYAQLTVSGTITPAFGYESAFELPNDFIRLLALGDVTINADTPSQLYDISGKHIFTDQEDEADTINIHYIKDETSVSIWDALFVKLMYLELAKDMAYAFTVKPSRESQLEKDLVNIRLQAAAVNGQEKPPRRLERSRLLARRMGGGGRDTTRYSV